MSDSTRTISVLGSTGSVGTQVLDVAERLGERIRVHSLAAGGNIELLAEQAAKWLPKYVIARDAAGVTALGQKIDRSVTEILLGEEGMCQAATDDAVDVVVVAVQGFPGLAPTIAAAEAGKDIAVASKEVLVVAGGLVRDAIRRGGVSMVPIDSEHSAIFQCLTGEPEGSVEALILTASGGPCKYATARQMADITPEMALNHPTWKMGRKITVDSATLMNKGLEILEAEALFGVKAQDVEVVIHPKSIVHSLVRFRDGSVKAQLGLPDMRLPIQYALLYPERPDTNLPRLDLLTCGPLEFIEPDFERFPALGIARAAGEAGGIMPAVMSAADDVAVESFLDGGLGFLEIIAVVEETMASANNEANPDLETIVEADRWARVRAADLISQRLACRLGV
ncbi:MAG: 1-deoxy-D-xylulose-5-phosphate reductoisomerase [Armatimonadota bacterium]